MVTLRQALAPLLAAALLGLPASAQAGETLYIETGVLLPVSGEAIPGGRIVVRDGRVTEVGATVERPPFSRLVDARAFTVTPGFVVPMSTLGMPRPVTAEPGTVTMTPATKAADEIYPLRPEFALALQHGITTLGLLPAAAGVGVLGQAAAIRPRAGTPQSMTLKDEAAVVIAAAAHGTFRDTLREAFAQAEKTLAKEEGRAAKPSGEATPRPSLDTTRQAAAFARARSGGDKRKPAAKKESEQGAKPGARRQPPGGSKSTEKSGKEKKSERSKDPLIRTLQKEQPVLLSASGTAAWTTLRDCVPLDRVDASLVDGWGFHALADDFKEAGVRIVTWPSLSRIPRTRQPLNRAAAYEKAGVPYAFALPTDSVEGAAGLRDGLVEMARTGCSRAKVLEASTREAARVLGIEDQVGSIQAGRRADLLFWSGDPFDPVTRLERVMSQGEFVPRAPAEGVTP